MALEASVFLPFLQNIRTASIALYKSATETRVARTVSDADREELFHGAPGLAAVFTHDGRFVAAANEWEAVLGYDPDELEGHNWREFVHPDDIDSTVSQKRAAQALDPAGVVRAENRWRHRDGHYIPMHWIAAPWDTEHNYAVAVPGRSPSRPPAA